jgi:D-alanyl-D-alanine carboxypeptidase
VIDGRDVIIVLLKSWGRLTRIGDANRVRAWMESSRRSTTELASVDSRFEYRTLPTVKSR